MFICISLFLCWRKELRIFDFKLGHSCAGARRNYFFVLHYLSGVVSDDSVTSEGTVATNVTCLELGGRGTGRNFGVVCDFYDECVHVWLDLLFSHTMNMTLLFQASS